MVKSREQTSITLTVYGIRRRWWALHVDNPRPHHLFMEAMIPLVLVIGINALLTMRFFRIWISLQAQLRLGYQGALGLWSIIIALVTAIVPWLCCVWAKWTNCNTVLTKALIAPCCLFLIQVQKSVMVRWLRDWRVLRCWRDSVLNLSRNNPLISEAVAMTTQKRALRFFFWQLEYRLCPGQEYLAQAVAHGINPGCYIVSQWWQRGGQTRFSPHGGAVITLFAICHLTHKQSYKDVAMVMAIPDCGDGGDCFGYHVGFF